VWFASSGVFIEYHSMVNKSLKKAPPVRAGQSFDKKTGGEFTLA
jgi:hypothetical protein